MDVAADFAVPLPLMVIAEMLGVPAAERQPLKRWSEAILGLSDAVAGGETAARAVAAFRDAKAEMEPYVERWLAERRVDPADDLLTRLVEAEVDGERLTGEEILGFFQLLLLAGSETTTNLIGSAVLCLADNPEQLARLRADPALLPSAIEEVLRYRSPLADGLSPDAARRRGARPKTIPAGKLVLVMIGSANRDPRSLPRSRPVRHHARPESARRVRARHPLLHRSAAGTTGGADRLSRTCWSASAILPGMADGRRARVSRSTGPSRLPSALLDVFVQIPLDS